MMEAGVGLHIMMSSNLHSYPDYPVMKYLHVSLTHIGDNKQVLRVVDMMHLPKDRIKNVLRKNMSRSTAVMVTATAKGKGQGRLHDMLQLTFAAVVLFRKV